MNENFEELSHETDFVEKLRQFHDTSFKIRDTINLAATPEVYEKLSNAEKIKYNLLMSYSLNSMFWMYLRSEGIDPMKHRIKGENDRLKKSMTRSQQIHDRNTLMPRINKEVAKRLVRNGLWELKK